MQRKYDSLISIEKDLTGERRMKSNGRLIDHQGNVVIDKEKLKIWQDYITELFSDAKLNQPQCSIYLFGPCIGTNEVRIAINQLKNLKATGPDEFKGEFLKLLDENGIKWLMIIYNKIYDLGRIPESWLTYEFITFPKNAGAKKCGKYRRISLISHLLKTFLKIIHRRMYNLCEENIWLL